MAAVLTLAHFLEVWMDYQPDGREPAVADVVTDSRDARPGALFMAIPGEQVDGHDFVADAFSRGAVAALVNRPLQGDFEVIDTRQGTLPEMSPAGRYLIVVEDTVQAMQDAADAWMRRLSPRVIGITGSVGKTSTKELTHTVLSQRYNTFKSPGNRNSILGLPAALFGLRPGHERAVLEMGMYTIGEIRRLCEITRPAVGVVTVIDPVHMERAGSLENIVAAKRELVEALPGNGVAVLNEDEPLVKAMANYTPARIITYGLSPRADIRATDIESMGLNGVSFTLQEGAERLRVRVPLLGRHSVHTALRAAAVGRIEGLTWEEVIAGLQAQHAQLRLVTAPGPHGSLILDDTYNASPSSMLAALNLLEDLDGRRIAVLGDMLELGQAEEESHRLIGRRARQVAQVLVTVGERGRIIAAEALRAGMPTAQVHSTGTAGEAIALLRRLVTAGDVILVKGSRAVHMDEIVAGLVRPEGENVDR